MHVSVLILIMKIDRFTISSNHTATTIIKSFFGKVLSSTPVFRVSSNRVILQLFYYNSGKIQLFSDIALNTLGIVLSELYPNKTLELRFIRLQHPYLNSSILSQYLAINASKYNFNRLQNILLCAVPIVKSNVQDKTNILSQNSNRFVTGVKVQLSGLLTTQRAAPRKTVYTASVGTFSANALTRSLIVEYANTASKSRDGAFNIKVWISSIAK